MSIRTSTWSWASEGFIFWPGIAILLKKSLSRLLIILTGAVYQSSIKVGETVADPAKTGQYYHFLSVVLTGLPGPLTLRVLSELKGTSLAIAGRVYSTPIELRLILSMR